jgi:hypothetical protein
MTATRRPRAISGVSPPAPDAAFPEVRRLCLRPVGHGSLALARAPQVRRPRLKPALSESDGACATGGARTPTATAALWPLGLRALQGQLSIQVGKLCQGGKSCQIGVSCQVGVSCQAGTSGGRFADWRPGREPIKTGLGWIAACPIPVSGRDRPPSRGTISAVETAPRPPHAPAPPGTSSAADNRSGSRVLPRR